MSRDKTWSIRFHPKDYVTDPGLANMSWAAQGVYWRVCCHMMIEGGAIWPDELRALLRLKRSQFDSFWNQICGKFVANSDGSWSHPRVTKALQDVERQRLHSERSNAAQAEKRRLKDLLTKPNQTKQYKKERTYSSIHTTDLIPTEECAETLARSTPPPFLTCPVMGPGPKTWELTEERVGEWQKDFPALDVRRHCREAAAWVRANPGRQKTARGMPVFFVRWLTKEANRATSLPTASTQPNKRIAAMIAGTKAFLEQG